VEVRFKQVAEPRAQEEMMGSEEAADHGIKEVMSIIPRIIIMRALWCSCGHVIVMMMMMMTTTAAIAMI
jgi:hypothetical protein